MSKKSALLQATIVGSVLAISLPALAAPKWAQKGEIIVKCQGISKKGANDCGANGHDCANQAVKDNDSKEWVYVPEGVCEKIAGGVVFKSNKVE